MVNKKNTIYWLNGLKIFPKNEMLDRYVFVRIVFKRNMKFRKHMLYGTGCYDPNYNNEIVCPGATCGAWIISLEGMNELTIRLTETEKYEIESLEWAYFPEEETETETTYGGHVVTKDNADLLYDAESKMFEKHAEQVDKIEKDLKDEGLIE